MVATKALWTNRKHRREAARKELKYLLKLVITSVCIAIDSKAVVIDMAFGMSVKSRIRLGLAAYVMLKRLRPSVMFTTTMHARK